MIIISLHRMQSDLAEGAYAAEEADDASASISYHYTIQ